MPNKVWLGVALMSLVGCNEGHDNEVHDKGEVCLYADAAARLPRPSATEIWVVPRLASGRRSEDRPSSSASAVPF